LVIIDDEGRSDYCTCIGHDAHLDHQLNGGVAPASLDAPPARFSQRRETCSTVVSAKGAATNQIRPQLRTVRAAHRRGVCPRSSRSSPGWSPRREPHLRRLA
jgi:hypothetical protein